MALLASGGTGPGFDSQVSAAFCAPMGTSYLHQACACWWGGRWSDSGEEPIAALAQSEERQTEDLKVPGSITGIGIVCRLE